MRDHSEKVDVEALRQASDRLSAILERLKQVDLTLNQLRGFEGEAGMRYFEVFDHLITSQKKDFNFKQRNRRPPLDPVNCLLSFIYTLLLHDVRSALESVGLDPAVGFLHRDRPGRPGLALDMMEEFRAFLADRLVLSMINLAKIRVENFTHSASGAVLMNDEAKKVCLTVYQMRKQDEITHPFIGEKMTIGMLIHVQAILMARFMRGDLDGYPAFCWR